MTGIRLDNALLDHILSLQFSVAWAGENPDEKPRLGWWKTDLVDELGGGDFFARLTPRTQLWTGYQAAREAGRRRDTELRGHSADRDKIITIFHLGFDIDEQVQQRLIDLKLENPNSAKKLEEHLPKLFPATEEFKQDVFEKWLADFGKSEFRSVPAGRLLVGKPPTNPRTLIDKLMGALLPLPDNGNYPMPHVVLG